jgi:cell division protein FtsW (lipid II flippase)
MPARARLLSRVPWSIAAASLLLMGAGLAGIARGDELSEGETVARQAVWIVLSLPAMVAAAWLPYRFWKPWSAVLFAVSLVLLVLVYFTPARHGAHSWIPLGFINLQPSEPAKLAFILMLSHYLMYERNHRTLAGLVKPFLLTLVPLVLILREPDLGTAILFLPVLYSMLLAAGARLRHLALVTLLGVALTPALWKVMSAEQRSRVTSLFRQRDGGEVPRGDDYHLHQSKQVIALGGPRGSDAAGLAVADPLAYHLPASRTDFVFCLIAERWGTAGVAGVLGLYLWLIGRGLVIAARTREPYGRLLAVGVVTLLGSQVVINTGMTVGFMPITGLTLPLMSYGGSSLMVTCIALGLLMNVALRPGYEVTAEPFRFS